MRRLSVVLVVGLMFICACGDVAAEDVKVIVGSEASWLEKHAARELAKYATQMSGAEVRVEDADGAAVSAGCILVGTPESNPAIAQLEKDGAVDFSTLTGATDGFLIRSIEQNNGSAVVIGGRPDRATLYGVYHYLEKYHHVGFFWDGERVPKGQLEMADLDEVQISPFEIRWLHRWNRVVMKKYTGWMDTVEEWKRDIDWQSKVKLNATAANYAINRNGLGMADTEVDAFGVRPLSELPYPDEKAGPWAWWPWTLVYSNKEHSRRNLEATRYMHDLGIRTSYWVGVGEVPDRYKATHPEKQYFGHASILAPSDPDGVKLTNAYARAFMEKFGTSSLYTGESWGEEAPGKEPLQLKTETTIKTAATLRQIDNEPSMIYLAFGWDAFVNPRHIWSKRNAKKFLEAMPDHMWCYDLMVDLMANPYYEAFDGYFGRRWAFGVIGDLGGDDSLHGDFQDLLTKAQIAVRKYPNCRGFTMGPENSRLNLPFYDFLARVAWNPEEVDVDAWVEDFCLRRYGPEAAAGMASAWRAALPAMALKYPGWWITPRPLYQIINRPPLEMNRPILEQRMPQTCLAIAMNYDALTRALEQRERLAESNLYENDVVDIARTFLHRVTDYYLVEWVLATERGDTEAADASEKMLFAAMDWVKLILSHRPDYHLATTRDLLARADNGTPHYEKIVRHNAVVYAYDTFDSYEQMEHYYKPLVRAYMAFVCKEEHPTVDEVVEAWMKSPLELGEEHVFPGTTVEAVSAMAQWAANEMDMKEIAREGERILRQLSDEFDAWRTPLGPVAPSIGAGSGGFLEEFDGAAINETNWACSRGVAELIDGVLALRGGLETIYDFECRDWALEFRANFLPGEGNGSVKVRTGDTEAIQIAGCGSVSLSYPTEDGTGSAAIAQADATWRLYKIEKADRKLTVWVDGEKKGTYEGLSLDADKWYLELMNMSSVRSDCTSAGVRLSTPLLVDWVAFEER